MSDPVPSRPSVLIAGAGPTGLVLALSLARRNVPVRIVDQAAGPGEHSRAMVVHARTLEFYRQFGFADEIIEQGIKVLHAHLREGGAGTPGHEVASLPFGDIGGDLSPYPFPLAYPQDDHQRLLIVKLRDAGIDVEWRTKLTGLAQDTDGASVTLEKEGGQPETVRVPYLCGCDGAHSAVRKQLRLDFSGGTSAQLYFVIDAKLAGGFDRDLTINLGEKAFVLLLPVRLARRAAADRSRPARAGPRTQRRQGTDLRGSATAYRASDRPAGHRNQLAGAVPHASPRRRAFPGRPCIHSRRRGAYPQPARRPGHEYRDRRRDQSRLEARDGMQGRADWGRADAALLETSRPNASALPGNSWRRPTAPLARSSRGVSGGGSCGGFWCRCCSRSAPDWRSDAAPFSA